MPISIWRCCGSCGKHRGRRPRAPALAPPTAKAPHSLSNLLFSRLNWGSFLFGSLAKKIVQGSGNHSCRTSYDVSFLSAHFLDIGPDVTRVGLLQYGSTVKNEFSLKTFKRKSEVEHAVKRMRHLSTGTMTGLAIQYALNIAFSEAEGARPLRENVPRVIMIVTDGRPQDSVAEVAAKARDTGILIFAIGVGQVDFNTLKAIGSEPHEDHVFLVANFSQIESLTSVFQNKLCTVHMCSILGHNCAHFCINTPGSYVCRCKQGYILNSDQTTCRKWLARGPLAPKIREHLLDFSSSVACRSPKPSGYEFSLSLPPFWNI
eukprot:bmy_10832T0